jgi:hypothetical protein
MTKKRKKNVELPFPVIAAVSQQHVFFQLSA